MKFLSAAGWACAAGLGSAAPEGGGGSSDLLVAKLQAPDSDLLRSGLQRTFDGISGFVRDHRPITISSAWNLLQSVVFGNRVLEIMDGSTDTEVQKAIGPYGVGLATSYQDMPRSTCRVEQTVHMHWGLHDDAQSRRQSEIFAADVKAPCFDVRSERLTINTTGQESLPWWSKSLERYTIAQDRPRSRASKSRDGKRSRSRSRSRSNLGSEQAELDKLTYRSRIRRTFVGGSFVKDEWHYLVTFSAEHSRVDASLQKMYKIAVKALKGNVEKVRQNILAALETFGIDGFNPYVQTYNEAVDPSPMKRGKEQGKGVVFETSYYKFEDNSCVVEQILYWYDVLVPAPAGRDRWHRRHIVIDERLPQCDMAKVRELRKTSRTRSMENEERFLDEYDW